MYVVPMCVCVGMCVVSMCVFACMCGTHVCVFAYVYVYMCVVPVCVIFMCVCLHVYVVPVCVFACVYVRMCMDACAHVCRSLKMTPGTIFNCSLLFFYIEAVFPDKVHQFQLV